MPRRAVRTAMLEVIESFKDSGQTELIEKLLTSPTFIQDRIAHSGVGAIYEDLSGLSSLELARIREALKRDEHVIRRHPEQTTQQLFVRMPGFSWYPPNASKGAALIPESLDFSKTDASQRLIQTIPTSWERRGFADRTFPEFHLSDDKETVFLTYPDACKVVEYSLVTGEEIETHNFKPNFTVHGDGADFSYPIIEAIARLSNERFLIAITSQNAGTFDSEHTVIEYDMTENKFARFSRGHEHPVRHIIVVEDAVILVTIKGVIFSTVDDLTTGSSTTRLAIETHENGWISDVCLNRGLLVLASSNFVSVVDVKSKKLLHQLSLADFLGREADWNEIGFGFSNPVPTSADCEFFVRFDRKQFRVDGKQGLPLGELPSIQGRHLFEDGTNELFRADGTNLFSVGVEDAGSDRVLTGTGGEFLQIKHLENPDRYLTFNTNGDFQLWTSDAQSPQDAKNRLNLGSSIEGICRIQDGGWVAWTSSGAVYVKQATEREVQIMAEYSEKILSISIHPWHPVAVITVAGRIALWSLETLKLSNEYRFYESDSLKSYLSIDGFRIYATTMEGIMMCSVFQNRMTCLTYEWITADAVRISEWPDGQHLLIKGSDGRTLLIDQYNAQTVFDFGGNGGGGQPTNLYQIGKDERICFGTYNTIETWSSDFTRQTIQQLGRSSGYAISVLHLEDTQLLLIDDGLYLDAHTGAKLELANSRSKLQVVDQSPCSQFSLAVDGNTLRVGAILNPKKAIAVTLDSAISDAKFVDGSAKILVGDRVGNLSLFRLEVPPSFAEMSRDLTDSDRSEYHENFFQEFNRPTVQLFYPAVGRSKYCHFCNAYEPRQSIKLLEKCVCMDCADPIEQTLGEAKAYKSRVFKLPCTICGNCSDIEGGIELEFFDILHQRLCGNCLNLLNQKIGDIRPSSPEEPEAREASALKPTNIRRFFWRKDKRNLPLHWLYGGLRRKKDNAVAELAEEIGSVEIAKKVSDAFAEKKIQSLSHSQKFVDIDDEIQALCMLIDDREPEHKEINWLLHRIELIETPHTLHRFAETVSDYPYHWADRAEAAAHRALKLNDQFAAAWQVIAQVRYSLKMDVLGASNAYVHYSRCNNPKASILIEAAEFDLSHFTGPCSNAAEYLETAEAMLNSLESGIKKIRALKAKYSDKLVD